MAYKITDDCISCGACEFECKNEAISEGEETKEIYQVLATAAKAWIVRSHIRLNCYLARQ